MPTQTLHSLWARHLRNRAKAAGVTRVKRMWRSKATRMLKPYESYILLECIVKSGTLPFFQLKYLVSLQLMSCSRAPEQVEGQWVPSQLQLEGGYGKGQNSLHFERMTDTAQDEFKGIWTLSGLQNYFQDAFWVEKHF